MDAEKLRARTKALAVRVIRFVKSLPRDVATEEIGGQVVRSAMSVGANYRAACRARSKREFAAKMQIVQEEADESQYWLEILDAVGLLCSNDDRDLLNEASELNAIFTASITTIRRNKI